MYGEDDLNGLERIVDCNLSWDLRDKFAEMEKRALEDTDHKRDAVNDIRPE